jgi:hypothetical protein
MSNRLAYALHHTAEARKEIEREMRLLADQDGGSEEIRLLLAASWSVRCAEVVLHEIRFKLECRAQGHPAATREVAHAGG